MNLTSTTFEETTTALLAGLDARSRDIVVRRYGLKSGSVETLESIGKEYGVTRERVRQIEAQAKKLLARRDDLLSDVKAELHDLFTEHGGILAEDHLLELAKQESGPTLQPKIVSFYLYILPHFDHVVRSPVFAPHWVHAEIHQEHGAAVVEMAENILKRLRHPQDQKELVQEIRRSLNLSEQDLADPCVYALLRASKRLKQTVFGEWGLLDWVETRPRGVGDKAYVVLRRHGKSEHFLDITEMINEAHFDHKNAHAQTVHNELIKDDRFVLVGRGLYGLKEWGYIPGTVAQVLEAILAKSAKPLSRDELLERVLEQRMVKKTTVLLGLQNSSRILRVEGDHYTLR